MSVTSTEPSIVYTDKTPKPTIVPPPAPAVTPAATAEELEAQRQAIQNKMGWKPASNPTAPATPAAAAPVAPAPAAVAPAAPAATPAPATPLATPPAPIISMVDEPPVARSPARPTLLVEPGTPPFEMVDDDVDDWNTIRFLQSAHPDKFAGKLAGYENYVKAYYAYEDKWRAEHPGESFNPQAEEHAQFFKDNPIVVTDKELKQGRDEMIEERVYQKRIKPAEDMQRRAQAIDAAMPEIMRNVGLATLRLVQTVDPEMAKIVTAPDGSLTLADGRLQKCQEHDATVAHYVDTINKSEVYPMILALEMTTIPDAGINFDSAKNPLHHRISMEIGELEAQTAKGTPESKVRDGKQFVTYHQFQSRIDAIKKQNGSDADKATAIEALENTLWRVGIDDIEGFIVNKYAAKAKKLIESERQRTGKQPNPSSPIGQPATQPAPAPTPAPIAAPANGNGKPNPPTVASGADTVTPHNPAQPAQKNTADAIMANMYRK